MTYMLSLLDMNIVLLSLFVCWGLDRLSSSCAILLFWDDSKTISLNSSHKVKPGNVQTAETLLKPQNVLCG